MRVLHVINSLEMGGAEKLVSELLPIFNELGFETELLLLKGLHTEIKNELEKKNIKVYDLGVTNVYNPFIFFKLIKVIKRYDVVNVHLFPSLYLVGLASIFVKKKKKPKLVFTEHNTMNRRIGIKILWMFEKIVYSFYEKIVCITVEVENIFKKYLEIDKNRFEVIENGIDLDKITNYKSDFYNLLHLKKELSINESDIVITQVSSFRDQKDQITLIKSLTSLPDDFKVIFLGEGKNLEKCKQFSARLGVQDRTFFLGIKQNVYDYFEISKFIVLSSHYEGLSLSSIEGMASGRPFIASDVPGLREIVGGAGVLFEESNSEDLARKITMLNNDKSLYDKIVKNCKLKASKYSIRETAEKYLKLYKSL